MQPTQHEVTFFSSHSLSGFSSPQADTQKLNQSALETVVHDNSFNPVNGEMALWKAVITQALMDASNGSKKREARYIRNTARAWLLGGSKDFLTVCLNAGLEPDDVRRKAHAAVMRGCTWRKETAGPATPAQERVLNASPSAHTTENEQDNAPL